MHAGHIATLTGHRQDSGQCRPPSHLLNRLRHQQPRQGKEQHARFDAPRPGDAVLPFGAI